MKNRKFLALFLALAMVLALAVPAFAEDAVIAPAPTMAGKTVILHSNDVHGAVAGYAYMAALKAQYEAQGAEVILVDAGDYSQGTTYVSSTKGADAVAMMNAAGYDVVTLGNHEFDYGYAQLAENMKQAKFKVLCADVFDANGKTIFDGNTTYTTKSGVKLGFFGMETPETQTKANPALIKGLKFATDEAFYAAAKTQVAALKDADLVICLAHLGVDAESKPYRSYDLYSKVEGIDFIIDGHSHTVMTKGENGEPIQSTGTAFANVGLIVIDDATKKIEKNELLPVYHTEKNAEGKDVSVPNYEGDAKVAAAAQAIIDRANQAFSSIINARVFVSAPPAIRSLGNATGFDFELQDQAGLGHEALIAARDQLMELARRSPLLRNVRTFGQDDSPQLEVDIDQEKAGAFGLPLDAINTDLSAAWGGKYVNDFVDRSRVKKVYVQADAPFRMKPEDFNRWYFRNDKGEMVPFTSIGEARWTYGPMQLERYNGVSAVRIQGRAAARQCYHKKHDQAANAGTAVLRFLLRGLGFLRLRPGTLAHVIFTNRAIRIDGPSLAFGGTGADRSGTSCLVVLHQRQQVGFIHLI